MNKSILEAALSYHAEGLNCIPIVYRDKKPALPSWEEYHNRISTCDEIRHWFGNGHLYNIGLIHCQLANGLYYVAIDIDHDNGLADDLFDKYPYLFQGRIEQSGSGKGYHVPLLLDTLPDFGFDSKKNRTRGNRTWKTAKGDINLRVLGCQTLAPPSVHPSGGIYHYVQNGNVTHVPDLGSLISWLNELAPPRVNQSTTNSRPIQPAQSNDLLAEVKATWDCLTVFEHFTMAVQRREELNGEIRLLGNGGLLITEDLQQFYNFSDEIGGDSIEAWGYCRFGNSYDKARHFRQVLLEMATEAGLDIGKFYQRGDENKVATARGETRYWSRQYNGYWSLAR